MANGSGTLTARRYFDEAMHQLAHDAAGAGTGFRAAAEADPAMADAWLGRIAAGDTTLATLQRLVGCADRSEEHTSELQSRGHLVCLLLLVKKKQNNTLRVHHTLYPAH